MTMKLNAVLIVFLTSFSFSETKLNKGAFVGVFTLYGQSLPFQLVNASKWISQEQVQREILFRKWQPPLTVAQMSDLARYLEADFSADILTTVLEEHKKLKALTVFRLVATSPPAIVYLKQSHAYIKSHQDLPQVLTKTLPDFLSPLPNELPVATVQMKGQGKILHMIARSGEWRKGREILLFRKVGKEVNPIGTARIIVSRKVVGETMWLLEAKVIHGGWEVKTGDKAIIVFRLPTPFERWQ